MFAFVVLAATSVTATLLTSPVVPHVAATATRDSFQRQSLSYDRVSLTRRLLLERSRARPSSITFRPTFVPQALHYRTILKVDCAGYCFGTDINNLGQILLGIYRQAPVVATIR